MKVYTDGSCIGNPGPGGWACVFEDGTKICGAETNTTNNRMELMAAIRALERTSNITIVTDSQYVKQGIETWIHKWNQNNWKTSTGNPVKNQDLWEKLDNLCKPHTLWEWVKGHTGHTGNEQADKLARDCAKIIQT